MAKTDIDKQAFLDALAKSGVVATALRVAGIKSRNTIANWLKDEVFAAAYADAEAEAADALEEEARRRAVVGVVRQRALGSGDNMTIVDEYVYSDTLLLALLKGNKPEKFAERTKSELSGPGGAPIQQDHTAGVARIAAMLEEAKRRRENGGTLLTEDDPLFG